MNKKNTPKGEEKSQGHRAEVERTGDKNKKQEKTPKEQQTKRRNTDGRSGSCRKRKRWTLLHHANLMLRSTGAAVVSEQGGRATKTKTPMTGAAVAVTVGRQLALLHRADLMPHSAELADWCDELSRGGEGRR
jgi:hypothetical protein